MRKDWRGARTFRLRQETISRLDELTKKFETYSSDIVDQVLEMGLDEIDSGRWVIDARPVKYEVNLIQAASAATSA